MLFSLRLSHKHISRPALLKPTFQPAVKQKSHSALGTLSVSVFCSKESNLFPE